MSFGHVTAWSGSSFRHYTWPLAGGLIVAMGGFMGVGGLVALVTGSAPAGQIVLALAGPVPFMAVGVRYLLIRVTLLSSEVRLVKFWSTQSFPLPEVWGFELRPGHRRRSAAWLVTFDGRRHFVTAVMCLRQRGLRADRTTTDIVERMNAALAAGRSARMNP